MSTATDAPTPARVARWQASDRVVGAVSRVCSQASAASAASGGTALRTGAELVVELHCRGRPFRVTAGAPHGAFERPAVRQAQRDPRLGEGRRVLAEPLVRPHRHPRHEPHDIGGMHRGRLERIDIDASERERRGGAVMERELSFQAGGGPGVDEHRRHYGIDVDLHRLHRGGIESHLAPEVEQRVDGRVRRRARRVELDRDPAVDDLPVAAQAVEAAGQVAPGALHRHQKALRAVDGALRRGEPLARQERRQHAVARGESRLQRLDHGAEVLLDA